MTIDATTAAAMQKRGWDLLTADDHTRLWEHFNDFRGDVAVMVDKDMTPYSPSLGGFTVGTGTNTGWWKRDDVDSNVVECWTSQSFNTGAQFTGYPTWGLPVAAMSLNYGFGWMKILRSGALYYLLAHGVSTLAFGAYFAATGPSANSARMTHTTWTSWAPGDAMIGYYRYMTA